ncbi:MAG: 4Fe-4S dicluster domain-containing protein [Lachnospiraceae bacterium]|nr:4Fe-4S dicluster domain-containing protein [Lachnospiraceae bacterium]
MKVAVLSGKGGAGKTLIAVNLAASAKKAIYIDCDVEEPNGRLFFKPENVRTKQVHTLLPEFDISKCTGCRKCVDFCHFNALIYIKDKPKVFSEVCHACGGCGLVCPEHAISEVERPVGHLEQGTHRNVDVITGVLNLGEASGIPVIRDALKAGEAGEALAAKNDTETDSLTVIDCPPGSACSVMESISDADCCLLAAEPTAFGFHNFRMVYELASLLKKPCGVIINKMDAPYEPLEAFLQEHEIPVLLRIPYDMKLAKLAARGFIACEADEAFASLFAELLKKIGGAVR